ncbi:hypothetical protein DL96DRAFT_172876 [Flagelloscypha sp. PMI_526]|nr:hypothetical protein DL96DRAFT_172876 [Flagelloscypha sp. PMI_526]
MSGRVERLLHWCSDNKIYINPIIQIYDSDSDGISVKSVSKEEIPPDVLLVKIPKSCVLSVRNCSLAKEIKALDLEPHGNDASMGLALALSVEFFVQKNKSQWWPYLQSMPAYVDLPTLFWNQSEPAFQYLRQARLCRNEKETKLSNSVDDFYHEKLRPFFVMNCSSVPAPTSIQFREMYSLVSSRAFIVDAYHGLCMVPIADAFNHSHPNHVQLESDYIVCPECGRLSDCPHDTVSSQENSETEDDDLEMTTGLTVDPFEEVFNTYGTGLKNADLLLLYGFVLEANDNDVVTIDPEEVWESFTNSNPLQKRFGSMDEVSHASRNLVMYICAHIEGAQKGSPLLSWWLWLFV